MVGLKVSLLGGFEARLLPANAPLRLPTKKAQALLGYLSSRPGEAHPRQKLASLLWSEKSDEQARGGLRQALVALRRALEKAQPSPLRIEGHTLALNSGAVERRTRRAHWVNSRWTVSSTVGVSLLAVGTA